MPTPAASSTSGAAGAASTAATAGKTNAAAAAKTKTSEEIQARFLKLLTTQLSNQDPLNPMDNAEMTSQLAQLSMVDGIERLNGSITGMAGAFEANLASQAVSLVGRTVLVPGSSIALKDGAGYAGFELPGAANKVQVRVFDAAGNEVERVDLGAYRAGVHSFQWDGGTLTGADAADGAYTYKIIATNNGSEVKATSLSYGKVAAVTRDASGLGVQVGNLGDFEFSQIRQYL